MNIPILFCEVWYCSVPNFDPPYRPGFDQMRRRDFITLLGGAAAAAWPLAARTQEGERMRRMGVLMNSPKDDSEGQARFEAFLQGLQQLGWTDGRNVRIDIRWGAASNIDRHRKHAAELVALAPDVILATTTPSTAVLQQATRTIPMVFAMAVDPVGSGLVESLARPGGNTTGFMQFEYSLSGKWLELLKQIAPGVTRAAVFRDPANPSGIGQFAVIQAMAPPLGMEVIPVNVRDAAEIERAIVGFRTLREWRFGRNRRAGVGSSRVDFQACGEAPIARGLSLPFLCHCGRAALPWARV